VTTRRPRTASACSTAFATPPSPAGGLRGLFVTGTDTGVGKTVVAAAVCAALAARGDRVAAFKPAVSGIEEPPPAGWSHDHELLAAAASAEQAPGEVSPHLFGPPLSPHFAAELAGTAIEPARLVAAARAAAARAGMLVCEGVGGLMVPLTPGYLVRDLALDLGLPLLVVARTGLGTINHTLLTLESARSAGLSVAGIVMTPWPRTPEPIALSNRETVELLGGVPVSGLPETDPSSLARAAEALPIDAWLGARHNAAA
jgi:dethiobiotin synthetase